MNESRGDKTVSLSQNYTHMVGKVDTAWRMETFPCMMFIHGKKYLHIWEYKRWKYVFFLSLLLLEFFLTKFF
jgi:hypothetical protein